MVRLLNQLIPCWSYFRCRQKSSGKSDFIRLGQLTLVIREIVSLSKMEAQLMAPPLKHSNTIVLWCSYGGFQRVSSISLRMYERRKCLGGVILLIAVCFWRPRNKKPNQWIPSPKSLSTCQHAVVWNLLTYYYYYHNNIIIIHSRNTRLRRNLSCTPGNRRRLRRR